MYELYKDNGFADSPYEKYRKYNIRDLETGETYYNAVLRPPSEFKENEEC